jgi:hypothetical protein
MQDAVTAHAQEIVLFVDTTRNQLNAILGTDWPSKHQYLSRTMTCIHEEAEMILAAAQS